MVMRNPHRRDLDSSDREWQAEVAAPEEIIRQLDYISVSLCEIEQENLIGIYLHGSLAMGCFHPHHSDLDMLVLVEHAPAPAAPPRLGTTNAAVVQRPSSNRTLPSPPQPIRALAPPHAV